MAKKQPIYSADGEKQLMRALWDPELANNIHEFVRFVYPWGKENTPLADMKGPRNWQDELLREMSDYIVKASDYKNVNKVVPAMYKSAIASGRGIGKSATFAWLAHWLVTTRIGGSVWVTANGEPQLKTKTFPEISKWVTMSINSHWFEITSTKIEPAEWIQSAVIRDLKIDPEYWYIAAQLWSEENPDAFAGAHNVNGEMYLFDEASGIPSPIWTVAQGVFTEQIIDRYWLAFSNPRRNTGAFFECFHKNRDEWRTHKIDSRKVDIAPDVWKSIIKSYGADSDEARIEVYGQFPNTGEKQFISMETVSKARTQECLPDPGAPLVMGVDVARFGDDKSVIAFRKGRDARIIPWQKFKGIDTVKLAGIVADLAGKHHVTAIFVDGNGVGGGVVDNLKAWGFKVIEVQVGSSATNGDMYLNKRVEIWGRMKEWLGSGAIPDDQQLADDLVGPEYSYHPVSNKLVLEGKDKMKARGIASPDAAEALALTFSQPVARQDERHSRNSGMRVRIAKGMDEPLFSEE